MENQVADGSQAGSRPSAARPGESTDLAECLVEGQRVLEDIHASLDTRYPTESEEEAAAETETPPLRGIRIALALFVPTFLLVIIGLPHLLAPKSTPPAPVPVTMPLPSITRLGQTSRASTDLLSPPLSLFHETGAASDTWADGILAPASKPERVEPKPPRSAADTVSWTRAAAFADDRAATQLAGTMRNQGYRVDLRREDSAALPWVVWISKSPVPTRPPK